ncbi:MAG: YggT family protein [gamma proteobacterium symbiont of Bathyaustriella thionipta]|nr:YggT family protein [gamma proteobacterium symbiont of Bathyaustriella thionipta]
MGSQYLTDPATFLIQVIFDLYILLLMLRLVMQLLHVDFFNPMSQFVVRLTSPALNPLRRLIPGYGGIDIASILLMWLLKTLELTLLMWLNGEAVALPLPLLLAIPALIDQALNLFLFAIIIRALLSWLQPDPYHPVQRLLISLTEPLLRPARKLIPPVSGMDISPIAVIIGLYLAKMLIIPPLYHVIGLL